MSDLCELEDVKKWLGITGTGDDELIGRLITAQSAVIEQYCNRKFKAASYELVVDGNGKNTMIIPHYPIISVDSLMVNGISVPAYSFGMSGYGYRFGQMSITLYGSCFIRGAGNVSMEVFAGYQKIPADLAQACIELVALRYRERDRIGHISKSIAGETVSFTQEAMPDPIKQALADYRRVVSVPGSWQ
jgi:hypothetical protein